MSADEIEKLAALRERGVLTEEEFNSQKAKILASSVSRKGQGFWWKVPLAIFGVLLIAGMIVDSGEAGFPKCDGESSRQIVKEALEDNPTLSFVNHKLFDLDAINETSFDEHKPERTCQARAFLNSGERSIKYRLFQRGDHLYVEVNFL